MFDTEDAVDPGDVDDEIANEPAGDSVAVGDTETNTEGEEPPLARVASAPASTSASDSVSASNYYTSTRASTARAIHCCSPCART